MTRLLRKATVGALSAVLLATGVGFAAPATAAPYPGDVNGDSAVNFADLQAYSAANPSNATVADIVANWGTTAPVVTPATASITATAGDGTVKVDWTISAGTDGANGAIVSRDGTDTTGAGPWTAPNALGLTGTRTFDKLANGTPYTFTVQPTKDGAPVGTATTRLATPTAPVVLSPSSVTDTSFTYAGAWTTNTPTEHYSNQVGASATVSFTVATGGSTFTLRGVKNPSQGSISVAVDGGTPVTVNENSSTSIYNSNVWTSPALSAGSHTVVVKIVSGYGSVTGAALTNGTFGTPAASTPPASTGGPSGTRTLNWEDNFDGTAIDQSRWKVWDGNTMNNAVSRAANVTVTNGEARLQVGSGGTGGFISSAPYDGAGVNGTLLDVGEYTEARIYFPGASSTSLYNWSAWWTSGPGWPAAGEFDIAEVLGDELTVNYHAPDPYSQNLGGVSGFQPGNSWHTYGIHRKATSADVYWDGVLVKTIQTHDNGLAQALLLNAGGTNPVVTGSAGAIRVDYVRVYKIT